MAVLRRRRVAHARRTCAGCRVPLCAAIPACPNGGTTTLSGKAFSPALMNADPLYNALVYIPNVELGTKLPPLPDGPSCDRCKPLTTDDAVASAITGPDGSFTLRDVPAGTGIPLVLQLGPWRMQTTIDVMPCQDNVLPDGALRLPRNQEEGDIPLTAMVTGNVDKLQCLLRKIGIEDKEFTNPDGTGRIRFFVANGARIDANTPIADTLIGTTAGGGAWSQYTQVILPCEGGEMLEVARGAGQFPRLRQSRRPRLRHALQLHVAVPERRVRDSATWVPDRNRAIAPPDPLTATIDTAFPKGADFASWLGLVGALSNPMPPQIQIAQPRHDMNGVPAMGGGQRWIYSDTPATVQHYTVDTPVGATPDLVCGRVIFSDFHVLNDDDRGLDLPHGVRRGDDPQRAGEGARVHALRSRVVHRNDAATPAGTAAAATTPAAATPASTDRVVAGQGARCAACEHGVYCTPRRAAVMGDTYAEYCKTEVEGRLLVVTINRPEVMNALHPPANRALAAAFDRFAEDPGLWVAIITGAGDRAFSAGNDLKYQAAGGDMSGQPRSGFGGLTSRFDLDKPVIAAVNGVAMGGGFEIALACDLLIAADNATFALPEPRVGLTAYAGGMHRLPREIGMKQAMGMMLTGRRVGAEEG